MLASPVPSLLADAGDLFCSHSKSLFKAFSLLASRLSSGLNEPNEASPMHAASRGEATGEAILLAGPSIRPPEAGKAADTTTGLFCKLRSCLFANRSSLELGSGLGLGLGYNYYCG